ncbi:MAG: hypothetical protein ACJ75J_15410 [Cytophagaceae bacterium]
MNSILVRTYFRLLDKVFIKFASEVYPKSNASFFRFRELNTGKK